MADISELSTFDEFVRHWAEERGDRLAMREEDRFFTYAELEERTARVATALLAKGLKKGDRIAWIGKNSDIYYTLFYGAARAGIVMVPVGWRLAPPEWAYIINDTKAKILFLGTGFESAPASMEGMLQHVEQVMTDPEARAMIENTARAPFEPSAPDDAVLQLYTSGTTGNPKGVVHTHNSLINRAEAGALFDKLSSHEDVLAYLPPAWIGQNIFSYAQWLYCGYVVNCPESGATVTIDLKEVGPTYYFAPPRVFEGLLTSVMIRMEDAGAIKRGMFHYFMDVARKYGPAKMDGKSIGLIGGFLYGLGDFLVYGPLRNNLGMSRVRVAYTAGEAIGPDLFTFYRSVGVNLKQLYGSTETAVFVCLQPDHEARADTVGVPCAGVEIKVADNGEILVKSPGLLKGYYKNDKATEEVLTADGWYHTSDAGFLDAHGHLKIIDRVKDVGRIKGGSNDGAMFAPKYVENKLKFFPHIKEVVAYGDQREKVCVMINIDIEAVGNWAERRNLPYAGYTDLAQKPEVYALIKECVEKVNADLAADELLAGSQVSRFLVLHKELDADDGELTRTNKVRRGFIAEKYEALVTALYNGAAEQFIETQVKFEDGRTGSVSATLKLSDAKTFAPVGKAA